jgi:hypothetical protein
LELIAAAELRPPRAVGPDRIYLDRCGNIPPYAALQDLVMHTSLYMVIERFKGGDPVPVYRRFRDHGRLAPDGLTYVSSWVDTTLGCCYQLMETHDRHLLDEWIARWSDLVDFEVQEVVSSTEAAARVAPLL